MLQSKGITTMKTKASKENVIEGFSFLFLWAHNAIFYFSLTKETQTQQKHQILPTHSRMIPSMVSIVIISRKCIFSLNYINMPYKIIFFKFMNENRKQRELFYLFHYLFVQEMNSRILVVINLNETEILVNCSLWHQNNSSWSTIIEFRCCMKISLLDLFYCD